MKAFILAAGMGSRLKDLTRDNPKALVKFNGKPMLEHLINKLKGMGIKEIGINIHHQGDKILEFLDNKKNFGIDIYVSDERSGLLNTGGAIIKAKDFISGKKSVLVHNVDIITDTDLKKVAQLHNSSKNLVTLCVRNRKTSRYLLFSDSDLLVGWKNKDTGEVKWVDTIYTDFRELAYSGIYILNPDFIENIKYTGSFSIIDTWLQMAADKPIRCYEDNSGYWYDLGTIDRIQKAENQI